MVDLRLTQALGRDRFFVKDFSAQAILIYVYIYIYTYIYIYREREREIERERFISICS